MKFHARSGLTLATFGLIVACGDTPATPPVGSTCSVPLCAPSYRPTTAELKDPFVVERFAEGIRNTCPPRHS